MKKIAYLDMMERAFLAYTDQELRDIYQKNLEEGVKEHGFPRIAAVLGILIANGRKTEYTELFLSMMTLACRAAHENTFTAVTVKGSLRRSQPVGADFFVKELLLAIDAVERAEAVAPSYTERFRAELAEVDPYLHYKTVVSPEFPHVDNWGLYNLAGEYMRQRLGICDSMAYIEEQLPHQLSRLVENGMYRDPGEPMLYDLASRAQLAFLLYAGYDGAYAATIGDALRTAGLFTMQMQSVTGEIPYGGRSNQFLFNEAYLAACMELEASRYQREGKRELAMACKRSAALAFGAIENYMRRNPDKHVKNAFPKADPYGCEPYAYFDKYMISLASFLYLAYLMANDSIEEGVAPCERGGFVSESPAPFHKTFASAGGYSVELDTAADPHYDATGLGRIHHGGVYSHLGLSAPFTATPNYSVKTDERYGGDQNPYPTAISPVIRTAAGECSLATMKKGLSHTLTVTESGEETVAFTVRYTSPEMVGCTYIEESYRLSDAGLSYSVSADVTPDGRLFVRIPLLTFDGRTETELSLIGGRAFVRLNGEEYAVLTPDCHLTLTEDYVKNRGGVYRVALAEGSESVRLTFTLKS